MGDLTRSPFTDGAPTTTGQAYVGPFRAPQLDNAWAGSPLLTPAEQAALAKAPRGTDVTVRSKRIVPALGPLSPEHMYLEYDDGRNDLIARGGPSATGPAMAAAFLNGDLSVTGQVAPAQVSKDYGQGRVLYRHFMPGVSATDAARPAQWVADRAGRGGNAYDASTNSNSFAADALQETTGDRVRNSQTWGADAHILDAPPLEPHMSWPPWR
jgi:hypothetical protein